MNRHLFSQLAAISGQILVSFHTGESDQFESVSRAKNGGSFSGQLCFLKGKAIKHSLNKDGIETACRKEINVCKYIF